MCENKLRIFAACLGIFVGAMGIGVNLTGHRDYLAAGGALSMALCASFLAYVHCAYRSGKMKSWSRRRFRILKFMSIQACVQSFGNGTVVCTVHTITRQNKLFPEDGLNYWMSAIWFMAASILAFASFFYLRQYSREIERYGYGPDSKLPKHSEKNIEKVTCKNYI